MACRGAAQKAAQPTDAAVVFKKGIKAFKKMKPLFIPLKKQYYEEFEQGKKTTEYRQYGPRWNERVCIPGRLVILSCGYGKQRRIMGKIKDFRKVPVLKSKGGAAYWAIYGYGAIGPIAEIDIKINIQQCARLELVPLTPSCTNKDQGRAQGKSTL